MTAILEVGDNVFAKLRGYRPWPARVEGIIAPTSNKMKYEVYFYGTSQIGVCYAKDVYSYRDTKYKYGKISKIKAFNKALAEIEIAELEKVADNVKKEPGLEKDTGIQKVKEEIVVQENEAICSTVWCSMGMDSFVEDNTSAGKSVMQKTQPAWQKRNQESTANKLMEHEPRFSNEKSLQCDQYMKEFVDKKRFKKHIQTHRDTRPFMCNKCGKTFAFQHQLKAHLPLHGVIHPFKCDYCDQAFPQKSNLNSHIRLHQNCLSEGMQAKLTPLFECEYCSRKYLTKKGLLVHTQVHMEVRPYKCTHCSSAFYTNDALRKHSRRHTGDRPYECVHCHKTFTQRFSQQRHIQTFHSCTPVMDLGFSCDFCHKEFSSQLQLLTHLPSHKHELTW